VAYVSLRTKVSLVDKDRQRGQKFHVEAGNLSNHHAFVDLLLHVIDRVQHQISYLLDLPTTACQEAVLSRRLYHKTDCLARESVLGSYDQEIAHVDMTTETSLQVYQDAHSYHFRVLAGQSYDHD